MNIKALHAADILIHVEKCSMYQPTFVTAFLPLVFNIKKRGRERRGKGLYTVWKHGINYVFKIF